MDDSLAGEAIHAQCLGRRTIFESSLPRLQQKGPRRGATSPISHVLMALLSCDIEEVLCHNLEAELDMFLITISMLLQTVFLALY